MEAAIPKPLNCIRCLHFNCAFESQKPQTAVAQANKRSFSLAESRGEFVISKLNWTCAMFVLLFAIGTQFDKLEARSKRGKAIKMSLETNLSGD